MQDSYQTALIVGVGSGLSASLARLLSKNGMKVALAARALDKLAALKAETGAQAFACDATQEGDVARLFGNVESAMGPPDVVVYNASFRTRGPVLDLEPADVEKSLAVTAFGGFLVAQQAARRMLPAGKGAILFTGASASVKGYAQSAPFAMSKAALRGLAQSMARELGPRGIHVAHFVIDGGIRSEHRRRRRTDRTRCSIPTRSPRPISMSCGSRGVPGAWKWRCGRGSRIFSCAA